MGKKVRIWSGQLKSPPMGVRARKETGYLIRLLQEGEALGMPHSRPLPSIGEACHELRIQDKNVKWRIIYTINEEEIVILDVFKKKTQTTPSTVINNCKTRLDDYEEYRKKQGQK